VDVVVPFRGGVREREALRARLGRLALGGDDSLVVAENRATPGFGRNRGVERGRADWLLFLDADVDPPPDLLDRYFDPPAGERTALLAGGVVDEPVPRDAPPIPRYAHLRGAMSQENTFAYGRWAFPQSANLACRREAFEAVGGFREDIRAGEDADLTFRLQDAGWQVERREHAAVVHLSRQTIRAFIAQKAIHGAAASWLSREYPSSFPARRRPGLLWWGIRHATKGLITALRTRDRDKALWAVFEPLEIISFEFGRSLRNERSPR
jgi:GT2 family glycosyltransferase